MSTFEKFVKDLVLKKSQYLELSLRIEENFLHIPKY